MNIGTRTNIKQKGFEFHLNIAFLKKYATQEQKFRNSLIVLIQLMNADQIYVIGERNENIKYLYLRICLP
jgi:hypothetical protein